MAITWGAWQYGGGNGMRVGLELAGATPVGPTTPTVTFTFHVFTENQYQYSDSQAVVLHGAVSETLNFFNGQGGGPVHRSTRTYTYTYPAGSHGEIPAYPAIGATLTGAYNGVAPTAHLAWAVPPRGVATPLPPTWVSGTRVNDSTVNIAWGHNTTSDRPWQSQTVVMRRFKDSSWGAWEAIATVPMPGSTFTASGLKANRIYEFGVRSNNASGSSGYMYTGQVWMTPDPPLNVFTVLDPGGASTTTTWDRGAFDTRPPVTYDVQVSGNGGSTWVSKASAQVGVGVYTDTSPNPGSNIYRVRTRNPAGVTQGASLPSSWTIGNSLSTIVAPLKPTSLSPNGVPRDFATPVALTWMHRDGGDRAPQSKFDVQYSTNGGSTWTALATGVSSTANSYTVPVGTLANGSTYLWRVRTQGIASAGYGPWSDAATVTGTSTPTATIIEPSDYITNLPIQVSWIYNQNESSPQAWYRVTLRDYATGSVLETQEASSPTPTVILDYLAEDGERLIIEVQVRSAVGLLSAVSSETVRVALPVPAEVGVQAEYQNCTGTTWIGLNPHEPLPAPDDVTNLVLNPSFRATAGTVVVDQNLIRNPSFEGDLAGTWALGGVGNIARVPNPTRYGKTALRVIMSSGSPYVHQTVSGLTVGRDYTLSAYYYLTPGAEVLAPRVVWNGVNPGGNPVTISGSWIRSVLTFTATATSHNVRAIHTPATASGQVIYVDSVMLNEGTEPADFFDGDSVPGGGFTYSWAGAQYTSSSQRIGAKVAKSALAPYGPSGVKGWRGEDGASQVLRVPRVTNSNRIVSYGDEGPVDSSGATTSSLYTVSARLSAQGATKPVPVEITLRNHIAGAGGGSELLGTSGLVDLPADGSEVEVRFATTVAPVGSPMVIRPWLYAQQMINFPQDLPDTITVREFMVVADPTYTGPFFDGDSNSTSTAIHSWAGAANDSASVAEGRAETTVQTATVQRRINGGPWVTLVRDLPLPNTFIDVVPSTSGLNEYRVIGADAAPTYRTQGIVAVRGTDGVSGAPLWAFLSYGPGFSKILRIRGDLSITETAGRTRGVQALQGRRLPVLLAGQNRSRGLSVTGTAHYRDECRGVEPGDCEHDSPLVDWIEAGLEADLVCFRDYTGRRVFGTIGDVQAGEYLLGHANVSFGVTATDYAENYGIPSPVVV